MLTFADGQDEFGQYSPQSAANIPQIERNARYVGLTIQDGRNVKYKWSRRQRVRYALYLAVLVGFVCGVVWMVVK